jgi:hypothetical protein
VARPVNRNCLHCALKLDANQARQVHGVDGDGCWHESICHRRRSHYRNRQQNNKKRQQERRLLLKEVPKQVDGVYELRLPAPETLAAFLVFVRRTPGSPVHAIGAEIWQQGQRVGRIQLQHTMGMKGNDLSVYLQQMQLKLREAFGIERFEDAFVEIQPHDCPIAGCPLKPVGVGEH